MFKNGDKLLGLLGPKVKKSNFELGAGDQTQYGNLKTFDADPWGLLNTSTIFTPV